MMLAMMLSDAASDANAGSKLVSAIGKARCNVLPRSAARAGTIPSQQASKKTNGPRTGNDKVIDGTARTPFCRARAERWSALPRREDQANVIMPPPSRRGNFAPQPTRKLLHTVV